MKMTENSKERTNKASKGLFAFKHEVDLLEPYISYPILRGVKMESDIHLPNLIFFMTAMRPKTLGGMVAAKNCLSVITLPYACQN